MADRRPKLQLIAPAASPAEAAAIVAALERFERETAPRMAPSSKNLDPWLRAAMLEGVSRGPEDEDDEGGASEGDGSARWINT